MPEDASYVMKRFQKSDAEYQRYQQAIRKPGPVRRLTRDEIAALEHKRNLERYLRR